MQKSEYPAGKYKFYIKLPTETIEEIFEIPKDLGYTEEKWNSYNDYGRWDALTTTLKEWQDSKISSGFTVIED